MRLLLSLETSSSVCGVALSADGELVAQAELRIEKSHASHLLPLTTSLLTLAGYRLPDVEAVAISAGPGSYTGLRIGAASAKGLCAALGIPLIAVSTLQALAHQVRAATPEPARYAFCSLLDARRQEVFAGLFDAGLRELMPEGPHVLSAAWYESILAVGPVIISGSGAAKCRQLLGEHPDAFFLPDAVPSVMAISQLGTDKLRQRLFEDVAYFEPHYLKEVHTTTPRQPAGAPANTGKF